MPIQFQCPACAATIRVDESAAGKKGKCPQCAKDVIVPRPISTESPRETTGFPAISVQETSAASGSSNRRRKHSGSRFWSVVAPLFMFAVVVGTMVFLLWEPEPNLTGKLPGEFAADFEFPPKLLTAEELALPEDEFQSLLDSVRTNPPPLGVIPKRMRLTIDANEDAIRITFQKTNQTEVVRVSVDADRDLRSWLLEHREQLEKTQRREANEIRVELVKSLQRSYDENLPFDTAGWASRLMILFENGLGSTTEAVTADSRVRCVFESDAGELYFLLPDSTRRFTLEERTDAAAGFPGRYTIRLSPTQTAASE